MGAADGDGPFQAHDLREHLGAADDRHATGSRGVDFRIAVLDGGRNHDDAGVRGGFGFVADRNLNALAAQALDIGAVLGVGTGDIIAKVLHHRGDAGHADAANADEMNGPGVERNGAADHEFPKRNVGTV